MTIDDLKIFDDFILKQLDWNAQNVDKILQKIPELKTRILGKWSKELDNFKELELARSKMYGDRYKYYNEDYDRKLTNRKDIEDMINRESDYCDIVRKCNVSEVVVQHLEKMMKIMSDTDWNIRNWLDVKKTIRDFGAL